jgi:large subunit ribosomal protein L25
MMERPTLNVSLRENTGKGFNRRLRAAGEIPGVLYGQGKTPVSFSVGPKPIVAMLNGDFGKNTVMNVAIEGESTPRTAIIKDYQVHSWKRTMVHIDLWEITEDTSLSIEVPFKKIGVSAVEESGQNVRITRSNVKIRCTAANIPMAVEFDMTSLPADAVGLRISAVPMPEGVEALYNHDYNLLRFKVARDAEELEDEEGEGEEAAEAAPEENAE